MHDLKYREAATAKIPHWGWQMTNFVQSESLKPLVEAFEWSMVRTSNSLHLPAWIAFEATREQLWVDHSRIKCGAQLNPNLQEYAETEESPEMSAEYKRLVVEFRKLPQDTVSKLFKDIGIHFIEHRLANEGSKAISEGLKALYESVILDSWSAFETLMRDLWVVTLDQSPTIATKVHISGVLAKPKANLTATADLTRFGSLVLELRQASFQRLESITTNYEAAFGKEAVDAFDTVEDGFIRVLNAFRNVLMHNRGKLDLGFRQQVGKFTQFYLNMADGQDLPLDGEQVTKMRTAAMELGKELIQLADRALVG